MKQIGKNYKILSQYEIWLRSLIKELGPSQSRILLAILLNSSSIENPVKNAKDSYAKFIANLNSSKITLKKRSSLLENEKILTSGSVSNMDFISELTNEEKKYINEQKQKILFPLFWEVFNEMTVNPKSLPEKIYYDCKFLLKEKRINWLYFGVFCAVSLLVFYIVYTGWAEKPSINIEFNIGEIIGGILAGAGVLIAGKAYAQKSLLDRPDNFLKND